MTTRTITLSRTLAAVAVAVALAIVGATPASADPPPAASGTTIHGFVARRGVLTPIDHPDATTVPAAPDGGAGTGTTGINDHGQILGLYEGPDRVVRHFVRDKRGRYTELEDPADGPDGSAFDEYVDINDRGEIVGFYNDEQGSTTTGFLRTKKGRFVDITVPGSQVTGPLKINDRRQVVGIFVDGDAEPNPDGTPPPGVLHGFLWDDGDFETIDVPGAAATAVLGINNRGQMVGSYIDAEGAYHGFVRDRGGSCRHPPRSSRRRAHGRRDAAREHQRARADRWPCLQRPRRIARLPLRARPVQAVRRRTRRRLHPGARHQQSRSDGR
jgi:hypothetical protein